MPERLVWLSFADDDGFRGVAIVEIDDEDLDEARAVIAERFPRAKPGAEVVGAATRKAHLMGCNPGGSVMSAEMPPGKIADDVPRHRLMQLPELQQRGLV